MPEPTRDDETPRRPRGPLSLGRLFDLTPDQATHADIDATIRAGVPFHGTNLWILICATFVASVGLNVNSAATVIGAMLISPLMGPVMGIGYAAGVNDSRLLRSAAANLALAVAFALLTSATYFALTPLSEARSELLARTQPAIWDVLIAVFGGLAGIIAVTRRQMSNVIPGVAIATALMPPLCAAGYGIAALEPYFLLGALYLFVINCVFIATSTLVMVRLMGLPEVTAVDDDVRARNRTWIAVLGLLTAIPSVYLAYSLVQQELLQSRADRFVAAAFTSDAGRFVVGREVSPERIRVTIVGEPLSEPERLALEGTLVGVGLSGVHLEVIQSRPDQVDVATLRQQLSGDLYPGALAALAERDRQIDALEARLGAVAAARQGFDEISAELRASYPQVTWLGVGRGPTWRGAEAAPEALLVMLEVATALSEDEQARIRAWLKVRAKVEEVDLAVTVAPAVDEPPPTKGRTEPAR